MRCRFSAEGKIRIVLDGLRGEHSVSELCRREGIAESLYDNWSKEFLEAGKKRLSGDTQQLGDRQWMASEIDAMVEYFKASPAQNPDEPVLSPGDPERMSDVVRCANGIPIDDKTWSEIVEVAKANGVSAEQIEGIVGV